MSSSPYQIIAADHSHLKEAAFLFDQYRQFYGQKSNIPQAHDFLEERLRKKESIIYLAIDSKTRIAYGFMQLYPSFSSITLERLWILNDLYVSLEARNQGVGKALIKTAQDWVKQQGKGISLQTALDNVKAQKLYRLLGFNLDNTYLYYFWKR